MRILRWAYMQLHVFIKGHLPLGTLVQFQPRVGFDGKIYWRSSGVPERNSIGMVIDGWSKNVHPMPPGVINKGSVVLFDCARYEMFNWELEVIDEAG
jgi:hypothetical protein